VRRVLRDIVFVFLGLCAPFITIASDCEFVQDQLLSCGCDDTLDVLGVTEDLLSQQRYGPLADVLERFLMDCPQQVLFYEQYVQVLALLERNIGHSIADNGNDVVPEWLFSSDLKLQAGFGNNFNRAPKVSYLQLTIPNFPVIRIDTQLKSKETFASQFQLMTQGRRQVSPSSQFLFGGSLFSRESGRDGFSDYQGGGMLAEYLTEMDDVVGFKVAMGLNVLRYANDQYVYMGDFRLDQQWRTGFVCDAETGQRVFAQAQDNEAFVTSYYGEINTGLICRAKDAEYRLNLAVGVDWGGRSRPGGTQWQTRGGISGLWAMNMIQSGSFMRVHANLLNFNDLESYSPWLNDGVKREIQKYQLGFIYQWPLGIFSPYVDGVINMTWQESKSNISLFDVDYFEIWSGVSIRW
jgi:hypothetical protein